MEEKLKAALESIEGIKGEFEKAQTALLERVKSQDEEIKKHGGTMGDTSKAIKATEDRMEKLAGDFNGLKEQIAELTKEFNRTDGGTSRRGQEIKTLGQCLVESNEYKAWKDDQGFDPKGCSPHKLKSLWPDMEQKAVTGAADLRTVYATERLMEVYAAPLRRQRVRDLFRVIPTVQGSVQYIKETGYTNAAAIVAEGGSKPESALTFAEESVTIRTIAHHIPVPRQLVEDVPALQGYIDQRLLEGLKIKEDQQLLYGDGTGSNLLGVLQHPDIAAYTAAAGESVIDSVRKAITVIRIAEYDATGIVLHPTDWEAIELKKDSQNRYIWVQVTVGGEPRLWRLPVVDTTAITAGTFAVGAFDLACAIWDREMANIRVADQHGTDFTENMLRVLCEERIGLTVYRPESFCEGTFAA